MCTGAQIAGSGNQHYYANFRFHFCHRWSERMLSEAVGDMKQVDQEERSTMRQRLASQTGFTGLSVLHRLHDLYKFDVLKDFVFDTMHTLVLRIINRHLQHYNDLGLLKNPLIGRRLLAMPWTPGAVVITSFCVHAYTIYIHVPI